MDLVKPPKQIWFFSDPHFGHASLVFGDGKRPPARDFPNVEAMNQLIVENHNARVRDQDHWYCLGDVAMTAESAAWLGKLRGHGRLIPGNHDLEEVKHYLKYVKKVMAYRIFDGMLFSHMPVAPWSASRWRANVHGHCHAAKPMFYEVSDPDQVGFGRKVRYINISCEHTNYAPVPLEEISKWSRR